MECSKYFGAKWGGFIKSESILAPKGTSHFKTQNIRYDNMLLAVLCLSGIIKILAIQRKIWTLSTALSLIFIEREHAM